jgi:tRNA-specific 2-thiouridylase
MIQNKTNKKACPAPRRKVAVAMSGGVDSSVAAALLKKDGFNVEGVFMRLNGFSQESEKRAKRVAEILGVPLRVLDLRKEFKKRVIDYFINGHKKGITPNPCVVCNKEIKFGLLLEKALKMGADYVATGHYARVEDRRWEAEGGKRKLHSAYYSLLSGADGAKDQSYFLWKLGQKQLKHILFPVGNYTRKEVEKIAGKLKLPFNGVRKSVEVCFIPEATEKFLEKHLKMMPGEIADAQGKKIGKHKGLPFYTIGQRKGIGLAGGPYYVVGKDIKKNILIVSKNEKDLLKKELAVKDVSWTGGKVPKLPLRVEAKIRYRHEAVSATLVYSLQLKFYKLRFVRPQRAVTP